LSKTRTETNQIGDWQYLGREIRRRTLAPFKSVPFVFYFILAIVVLGGLGIWVEAVKSQLNPNWKVDGLLTALSTFFPALIGSASLQLILKSTDSSDKILISFSLLVCFLSFVGIGFIAAFFSLHPQLCLNAAIGFGVLAVWFWWFTNGDDLTFYNAPIDAATGGSTTREIKGNLNEFKVD